MSSGDMTLGREVQKRIDRHLDAIDVQLAARDVARSERRAITDEVEALVRDMLDARVSGAPTVADVEAVLAEIDPPESYGELDETPAAAVSHVAASSSVAPSAPAARPRPRMSNLARFAATLGICAILVALLRIGAAFIVPRMGSWGSVGQLTDLLVAGATILGLAAVVKIALSDGRLVGYGHAVFGSLSWFFVGAMHVFALQLLPGRWLHSSSIILHQSPMGLGFALSIFVALATLGLLIVVVVLLVRLLMRASSRNGVS